MIQIPDRLQITDPAQRKCLTSPLRLELLGHFNELEPLSAGDLAARMGRPVTALYYHINQLLDLGLLRQAGTRARGKRDEALFLPAAASFELAADSQDALEDSIATLKVAQRMAISDLRAAAKTGTARTEGAQRNALAFRLHAGLDADTLTKLNQHLDAIVTLLQEHAGSGTAKQTEFCSLTLALMPLKGRDSGESA